MSDQSFLSFSTYCFLANNTAKSFPTVVEDLVHAALGLATEVGEFTTEVKRAAIYEKPLTPQMQAHMAEELGDILWYVALACNKLGMDMEVVAAANIAKLKERFPEKYSNEAAEARADKGGADARVS